MKKVLKIIGLYLLFGLIIAVIASVLGLFTGMTGLLQLSTLEYVAFAGLIFGLCWLPYSISIIVSEINYFTSFSGIIIISAVILLFLLLSLRIILKKSK